MATTVGEIALGVTIDASKLTREVSEQVLPEIAGLTQQAGDLKKNLDSINAKPLQEIYDANMALQDSSLKVSKANRIAEVSARAVTNQMKAQRKAQRALTDAETEYSRQVAENGRAEQETIDKVIAARENLLDVNDLLRIAEGKAADDRQLWQNALIADQVRVRDALLSPIQAELDELRKAAREKANIAYKDSQTQIQEWERQEKESERIQRKIERDRRASQRSIKEFIRESSMSLSSVLQLGRVGPWALGSVVLIFQQLIGVAAQLSGAIGALPGIFSAAGAAMGTFMAATYGVEDTLSALAKGDLEAFATALDKLSPNAQQAILAFQAMLPALTDIQQAVQDNFFAGLGEQMYDLANAFLPAISNAMKTISTEMNRYLIMATDQLMSPETSGFVTSAIDNVVRAFQLLEPAIQPITHMIAEVISVSSSFLPQLSTVIVGLAEDFSTFIDNAIKSGDLQKWIQGGIDTFLELIPLVVDIGHLFLEFGQSAGGAIEFVRTIVRGLIEMMEFLNANGEIVQKIFYAITGIGTAFLAWKALSGIFKMVTAGLTGIRNLTMALAFKGGDFGLNTVATMTQSVADNQKVLAETARASGQTVVQSQQLAASAAARSATSQVGSQAQVRSALLTTTNTINAQAVASKTTATTMASSAAQSAAAQSQIKVALAGVNTTLAESSVAARTMGSAHAAAAAQASTALKGVQAQAATTNSSLVGLGDAGRRGSKGIFDALNGLLGKAGIIATVAFALKEVYDMFKSINDESKRASEAAAQMRAQSERDRALYPGVPIPTGKALADVLFGGAQIPTTNAPAPSLTDKDKKIFGGLNDLLDPTKQVTGGFDPGKVATQLAGPGSPGYVAPDPVGPFQIPDGGFAVPPPPAEDEKTGKKLSDSDILDQARKEVDAAGVTPTIDVWEGIGGVQKQPGWPGQAPLRTTVENLPKGLPLAAEAGYRPSAAMTAALPPVNLAAAPAALGANEAIGLASLLAGGVGLKMTSGISGPNSPTGRPLDGGHHDVGEAGDFSNDVGGPSWSFADNTPEMLAFAQMMGQFREYIAELIYYDPNFDGNIKDGQWAPGTSVYDMNTLLGHTDHVHLAIREGMKEDFARAVQAAAIPTTLKDDITKRNSSIVQDPTNYQYGYFQTDDLEIMRAGDALNDLQDTIDELTRDIEAYKEAIANGADYTEQLNDAQRRLAAITRDGGDLDQKRLAFEKAKRGDFKDLDPAKLGKTGKAAEMRLDDLPFGDPTKILGEMILGAGGTQADVQGLMGGFLGNAVSGLADGIFPQQMTPTAPSTPVASLVEQRNPLSLAAAAGLDVPDFTRQGGGDSAQNVMQGDQTMTANGQVMSNTAALIDRTLTNFDQADKARHEQVMSVLNQIAKRLGGDILEPTLESGVTAGISGISNEVTAQIGQGIGQAAGPIIAAEVAAAIPQGNSGNPAAGAVNNGVMGAVSAVGGLIGVAGRSATLFDTGGDWSSGTFGMNMSGSSEYVLNPAATAAFNAGAYVSRASAGGVDVTSSVGAEFLGVSQVPILSAIVNVLVGVLLKVLGVNIEARDTLNEIGGDFRDFRGEFLAFEASGRLRNDTSALLDRTTSSAQTAADERIRILRIVLDALVKYIIEKVIVPIGKAIGNALLQAGAGALQGGLGAAFPGGSIVGGIVGQAITAGGSAGIDIIAEVWGEIGKSVLSVVFQGVGEGLQSYLPGITTDLFGGAGMARLFDPITLGLSSILGGFAAVLASITDVFAGMFPGAKFDQGGVARGVGMMPKATIKPERVLSPSQTASFDRLVDALTGGQVSLGRSTTIHAPFTVVGDESGGRVVHDRLLALMS